MECTPPVACLRWASGRGLLGPLARCPSLGPPASLAAGPWGACTAFPGAALGVHASCSVPPVGLQGAGSWALWPSVPRWAPGLGPGALGCVHRVSRGHPWSARPFRAARPPVAVRARVSKRGCFFSVARWCGGPAPWCRGPMGSAPRLRPGVAHARCTVLCCRECAGPYPWPSSVAFGPGARHPVCRCPGGLASCPGP